MTQAAIVNLTSLKMVHDELVTSIEQSASKLEQFVVDMQNGELLQASIEGLQQISGTLNLVQLHGADLLAKEALGLATEITLGDENIEQRLNILTTAFFVIPRYVEYTLQAQQSLPVLLIPTINELRIARREKPLEESYFFELDTSKGGGALVGDLGGTTDEALEPLVRRLRHMYQVGLVSVLQGRLIKPSLKMMQRAMQRLEVACGKRPMTLLWRIMSSVLEVIPDEDMELTQTRKLLFGAIDREIKKLQNQQDKALDQRPPGVLLKDCIYLIALSGSHSPLAEKILSEFRVLTLAYDDKRLQREQGILRGPSATTVSSVMSVLIDELNTVKQILERASQASQGFSDFGELLEILQKMSDILKVVGLTAPAKALKEEMVKVVGWKEDGNEVDTTELVDVADAVLYVESTISGLDMSSLSSEKLVEANKIARREIVATSQLAQAGLVVLQEAGAGLSLVKRALNSFAESNFDRGHIKNVASTLNSVRGGMALLNLTRATAVVNACVEFVNDTLLHNDQPAALLHLLETFADAVIGVEYYLDSVKTDKNASDSVLEIAEESLEALGHPVQ